MSSHLPEPWFVKPGSSVHVVAFDGENPEPYTVANCYSGPFAPSREIARSNARRIVSAVNFCAGTATEYLDGAGSLGRLLARPAVNAELLTCCELALVVLLESRPYDPDLVRRVRAAIARARGATPPA